MTLVVALPPARAAVQIHPAERQARAAGDRLDVALRVHHRIRQTADAAKGVWPAEAGEQGVDGAVGRADDRHGLLKQTIAGAQCLQYAPGQQLRVDVGLAVWSG